MAFSYGSYAVDHNAANSGGVSRGPRMPGPPPHGMDFGSRMPIPGMDPYSGNMPPPPYAGRMPPPPPMAGGPQPNGFVMGAGMPQQTQVKYCFFVNLLSQDCFRYKLRFLMNLVELLSEKVVKE